VAIDPTAAAVNREVARGITAMVAVTAGKVIQEAALSTSGEMGRQLAVFAAAYKSSVRRSRGTKIANIHRNAAVRAQSAILTAYRGRNRRNPAQPYRQNAPGKWKRDSNGAMERGLNSTDFFKATGAGLQFINMDSMDRAARQWYRLNFGAGPAAAATPVPGAFPLQILGQDTGLRLSLQGFGASDPFMMPAGVWKPSGGGSEFVPIGYLREVGTHAGARNAARTASKKRMSLGFPGYNFLDAGMDDLAAGLSQGYTLLAQSWFKEAATTNKGPVAFVIGKGEASGLLPGLNKRIDMLVRRGLGGF
jgi:hypothetical protein